MSRLSFLNISFNRTIFLFCITVITLLISLFYRLLIYLFFLTNLDIAVSVNHEWLD